MTCDLQSLWRAAVVTVRIETFIPYLPWRELSPNGPHGDVHAIADAKDMLCSETMHHIQAHVPIPPAPLKLAMVSVVGYISSARPKIEDCPRCFAWLLAHPKSNHRRCRCYRPEDTPNLVSALKLMYDGWVRAEVLAGDRWDQMKLGYHDINPVQAVEEEGLLVVISEIDGDE